MKSKTIKKDKVNIITLGCSKNMVDSEVLSGQLQANAFDVVHENKKLDHNIVIVNTCGFIDKAKEESVNTILDQVESWTRSMLRDASASDTNKILKLKFLKWMPISAPWNYLPCWPC